MNVTLSRAYHLLNRELTSWFEIGVTALPSLMLAFFVVCLFWVLSRFATRVVEKLIHRAQINPMMASLLSRVVTLFFMATGLFLVLGIVGLQKTVTSLLAGAGVLGLVLGLAFQDFMSNFFASILISIRRPYQEGDVIESNDNMGTVVAVNLRNTLIRNFEGQQVLVPNRLAVEKVLRNYTRYGSRRVTITAGVAFDADLRKAAGIAIAAVETMSGVLATPKPVVHYEGFAASSIILHLRFWIAYPGADFFVMQSEAVIAVQEAFAKAKILIPFPVTTIELDAAASAKLSIPT